MQILFETVDDYTVDNLKLSNMNELPINYQYVYQRRLIKVIGIYRDYWFKWNVKHRQYVLQHTESVPPEYRLAVMLLI